MDHVFGIDLGTTYSCIAYVDQYGKAVVLKNGEGSHTTPSVVMIEGDNITVGLEAKRALEVEPDKTVQFIKRKMGKENDTVEKDGRIFHAPEISSYILKQLVADANAELEQTGVLKDGEEIRDVVITCPAYFGMNEREATITAGKLAGLNVIDVINEPTAAAISYGVSRADENETVLVYDLGGGTFDITVMNINGGDISVVCTGGDSDLGGKDWDEAVQDYVIRRYEEETGEDLSEDPEAVAELYVDVETWKIALTKRPAVKISVNGSGGKFREEFTRELFDELTEDLLGRTKNLLDDVLKISADKGYPLAKIDKILLVGGSTKMPQVAEMLERDYHVTPMQAEQDEAVAKGAAIYAANRKAFHDFVMSEAKRQGKTVKEMEEENLINGSLDKKFAVQTGGSSGAAKISITNVLSRTYGVVALIDGKPKISNLLMINDKLPAKNMGQYETASDRQRAVSIEIYESRSTEKEIEIDDRTPLTTAEMRFPQEVPKGTDVEITLALDNSGGMHIIAESKQYGCRLDTVFELSNQMNEQEMATAIRRTNAAVLK